jgi:hypothetical protein
VSITGIDKELDFAAGPDLVANSRPAVHPRARSHPPRPLCGVSPTSEPGSKPDTSHRSCQSEEKGVWTFVVSFFPVRSCQEGEHEAAILTAAVAERARVAKMTACRHFDDKDALCAGVITELCTEINGESCNALFTQTLREALYPFCVENNCYRIRPAPGSA